MQKSRGRLSFVTRGIATIALCGAAAVVPAAPTYAASAAPTFSVNRIGNTLTIVGTDQTERIEIGRSSGKLSIRIGFFQPKAINVKTEKGCTVAGTFTYETYLECGETSGTYNVSFDMKGGDDRVRFIAVSPRGTVRGGSGDDRLVLDTEARRTPGHAVTYLGGSGWDTVDYSRAVTPVHVSLGSGADDGRPGLDRDNIGIDVEEVHGSYFDDVLKGSDRDNVLVGHPGNDQLIDGAGKDLLDGGEGDDTLRSVGPADENPAVTDRLVCGSSDSGKDVAYLGDRLDRAEGCPTVHRTYLSTLPAKPLPLSKP